MPDASEGRVPSFEELILRLESLEARLVSVESRLGIGNQHPVEAVAAAEEVFPDTAETARLIPVAGISLLGVALGYLLRALCEMQTLALPVGLTLGGLYALGWLWWAAKAASTDSRVAAARAMTSVVILAPLVVEAEVRYHEISSWSTAAILVTMAGTGFAIAWRNSLNVIAWITTLAALLTASALLVITRDLLPFTWVLLVLAAAVEISACFQHWLKERWLVALAASLAVLLLTYITTRPGGIPEGYAAVGRAGVLAAQIALLVIYLASTMARTLWLGFLITNGEVFRCVTAYAITAWGTLRVANTPAALTVGIFSALCAVACYLVSFAFLERDAGKDRNFYAYAMFGLLLAFSGTSLLLEGAVLTGAWSVLAVVFLALGPRAKRSTLEWHGLAYLALAMASSGLVVDAGSRFFSSLRTGAAGSLVETSLAAAAAITGYVLLIRAKADTSRQALAIVLGIAAAWSAAGFMAGVAMWVYASPTLLTLVLTGMAVGLALTGRRELKWAVYLFMAVATCKLVVQDLRQAHMLGTVLSLLFYGGTLVFLPRLLEKPRARA